MSDFTLPAGVLDTDYTAWLKTMLVKLLTDRKDLIEKWINDEESQVFDLLANLVASQNVLLGAILAKNKDYIISLNAGLTDETLMALINALKS